MEKEQSSSCHSSATNLLGELAPVAMHGHPTHILKTYIQYLLRIQPQMMMSGPLFMALDLLCILGRLSIQSYDFFGMYNFCAGHMARPQTKTKGR